MAVFNPETPGISPDQTGASRGQRAAVADKSFASLFEGLGNAAISGFQAADYAIQKNIESDVYKTYDKVNDQFGIPAETNVSQYQMGDQGKGVPPQELQDSLGQLSLLQRAFKSGNLKSYHYWGRLENEVKRLRLAYPGYRDIIDGKVSQITGATPANALRNALLNEMESAVGDSADVSKKQYSWVLEHQQYLSPGTAARWASDPTGQFETARSEIQRNIFKNEQNLSQRNDLSLKESLGNVVSQGAVKQGTHEMDQLQNQIWGDVNSALGKDWQELKQKISEFSKNGLDAQETQQLQDLGNQLRQQFEGAIADVWSRPNDQFSNSSLNTMLNGDFSGRDAAIKEARNQFNFIVNSTLSGDFGVLKMNQAMVDATQNTDLLTAFGTDRTDMLRKMQVINQIGGQALFGFLVNRRPDLLSSTADAISDMILTNILGLTPQEQQGMSDYVGIIERTAHQNEKADTFRQVLDDSLTIITSSDSNPVMAKRAAGVLFSPKNNDFLKHFTQGDRNQNWIRLFSELASPTVTKKIIELGKESPETYQNYKNWIFDKWPTLFGPSAQEINTTANQSNGQIKYVYNPDQNEFFVDVNRLKFLQDSQDPASAQNMINNAETRILPLNGYIKLLGPIWENDKTDKTQAVKSLMDSIGIDNVIYSTDIKNTGKDQTDLTPGQTTLNPRQDLALLDQIGVSEGAGYNTFSGGSNQELEGKTVAEVRALQKDWQSIPGAVSSAAGKYQIISDTMDWLVNNGFLSDTEKFDQAAQDRAGIALLNRRGFGQFSGGRLEGQSFLNNLSQEWASIPNSQGVTAYQDGVNRVSTGGRAIAELLLGQSGG